jgi:nucleoid DNA-binding protein
MKLKKLIETVADETGLPKSDIERILLAAVKIISAHIARNGEIKLSKIGRFCVADIAEHEGTHPRTGERMMIARSRKIRFVPYKALKRAVL